MPGKRKLINLLPPSEFEASFWGRFLKWAVTIGRKVIILTELVVILAFLSRFKLDEDIRQRNDEIAGKRNLLEASMKFETEYNDFQGRLAAAKQLEQNQTNASKTLNKIASYFPAEVRIQDLLITKQQVNIVGLSTSENALKEMFLRMDKDPEWKSIELANINAEEGKGISFILNIYK